MNWCNGSKTRIPIKLITRSLKTYSELNYNEIILIKIKDKKKKQNYKSIESQYFSSILLTRTAILRRYYGKNCERERESTENFIDSKTWDNN